MRGLEPIHIDEKALKGLVDPKDCRIHILKMVTFKGFDLKGKEENTSVLLKKPFQQTIRTAIFF